MKLTWKQIIAIKNHTPLELKGKHTTLEETLGRFQPLNSNGIYLAGWTHEGDLVVTRFGEIQ